MSTSVLAYHIQRKAKLFDQCWQIGAAADRTVALEPIAYRTQSGQVDGDIDMVMA